MVLLKLWLSTSMSRSFSPLEISSSTCSWFAAAAAAAADDDDDDDDEANANDENKGLIVALVPIVGVVCSSNSKPISVTFLL